MGLERRRDTCDDIYFHYLNQYLTFEALDSGTFTLTIGSGVSTSILTSVSYSVDSGETWTTTNNTNNTQVVITTPTIAQGHNVLWKGIGVSMANSQLVFGTAAANRLPLVSNFTSSGRYSISGNIMSLLYGDNFLANKEFAEGSSHNFALLFYKTSADNKLVSAKNMIFPARKCPNYAYFRIFQMNSGLEYSPVISATEVHSHGCCNLFYKCSSLKTFPKHLASNLYGDSNYKYAFFGCNLMTKTPEMPASTVPTSGYAYAFSSCIALTEASDLPATTLSSYSYSCMFYNCTALTKAPEISATTLARSCCNAMFSGCVSLTKSPDLPATTLADNCYYNMFSGCTSLVDVPDSLPALVVPLGAYYQMFEECTSLTRTPNLSGQTIGNYGYGIMFAGCSSLVDVTPLNAYNLSYASYAYMFYGCTSLTDAPALPAETLGEWCYGHMFEGCTSLVNAPLLPAKKLVSACYRTMFGGCTNLRYVKCLAEDLGQSESSNPLLSWMSNVPSGGTFYKMNGVTWPSGASGIPNGWNVVEINGYDELQYLTFVSLEDNNTISFKASSANLLKAISVSTDGGKTWTEKTSSTSGTELATLNSGKKLLVKGSNTAYATSDSVYNSFSSTGYCDVEGNIQSLRYSDLFLGKTTVASYFANSLFRGFTKLKNAENLVLPTSVATFCYQEMFKGCSSLITAPYSLRATSLAQQCYHQMFMSCSSLKESPIIPASNLTSGLYSCNQMFMYCSSLERITCLATSSPSNDNYTSQWVSGVAATGTFVKNASATNWRTGASGIPSGWTVINDSSNGINEYSYIQNGLVFQLDGINRGTTDLTKWVDLIGNQEYVTISGDNATWGEDHLITPCEMFVADNEVIKTSGSTFEIVFYESTGSVNTILYINRNTSSTLGFGFGRYSTNYLLTNNSGYRLTIPLTTAPFGNTYCFSYNGDSLLVVNGQRITNTGTVDYYLNNTNNTSVAKRGNGGRLYCIRKYNRKLTEEEMVFNQQIDNQRFNLGLNI